MSRTPRTNFAAICLTTIALAATIGLSGCAAAATDISDTSVDLLQSTVVTAADQVAAGDSTGALATLDALQTQLQQAVAAGDVSSPRSVTIQQAIDLVRADLQPAPVVDPEPVQTVPDDSVVPEEPVTTTDTTVPEPADDSESTDDSDDDSGKGDKDNGNGNNGNGNGNKK